MAKSTVRRILRGLFVGVVVLLAVVAGRAVLLRPELREPGKPLELPVRAEEAARRLGEGIRFRTVSYEKGPDSPDPTEEFRGMHEHLERTYRRAHTVLRREVVGGASLLYTWEGSDPSLLPVLLMGHLDVVPVEPGTEDDWQVPPFSGQIEGGFVWGRGALDDKVNVYGLLEAVELLLERGFSPRRRVFLAFGHDEELGGDEGAGGIAALLEERGVELAFVLDEGGAVVEGLAPGLERPVAAVGVGEKGYLSVELEVEMQGGHSSAPPRETAIGVLARAVRRLEERQMPSHFDGPMRAFLEAVAPYAAWPYRLVLSNLWLFGPAVERILLGMPQGNAALRTTTAPTIFRAGVKDNVLPSRASAVVNFRIYPGETSEDVLEHVRRVVGDPRVVVRPWVAREPTELSPTDSEAFGLLERAIRKIFPDAVVAPNLIPGGTDARHFRRLSRNVYGFTPMRLGSADLVRLHGTNERLSVRAFADVVRFYAQLLHDAASSDLQRTSS
ncbi:MAG: peptidase M20 [Candidatus Binatia bacterium]|nr:MAG: peptidase M20 [Candidatus Binatia bacterium]